MLRTLRRRFTADRFAYAMTGAFGLCLILAISANIANYCLYEASWAVRGIELATGLGLIVFSIWGLRRLRRRDATDR